MEPGGTLDRGHRGGLPGRHGDARQLPGRVGRHRAAAPEHQPRWHRRQPGGQGPQVEHADRAAARPGLGHRPGHRLPPVLADARGEAARQVRVRRRQRRARGRRGGQRQVQGAGDRLRQADGRPDRRPDPGDGVLCAGCADQPGDHLLLYPLCTQHLAGGGVFADCGGMAAGYRRLAGLCHRPVFDPGAVPDLRHWRVPRGAEDERHPSGHRPWHPPSGGSALYLPPPVRGRGDCIAGRCGGLCRADADRHPGDPGPGDHRQHRRGGADLYLAAADARRAVVCRRGHQGGRAGAAHRCPRRTAPRLRQAVGPARPLHRTQVGQRRVAGRPGAGRGGRVGQPAAEDRRPRQRRP
ncbi:hypothetical protein D3C81_797610 [compost metagenome]